MTTEGLFFDKYKLQKSSKIDKLPITQKKFMPPIYAQIHAELLCAFSDKRLYIWHALCVYRSYFY